MNGRPPSAFGRNVSELDIGSQLDLDSSDFWIPQPLFEVKEHVASYGRRSAFGIEELVYEVNLDFGELGGWRIFVTRSNLSSLISQIQFKKVMLHFGGYIPAARKLSVTTQGAPQTGNAGQPSKGDSVRARAGSSSSFNGKRAQLIHQASVRTGLEVNLRRPPATSEDEESKQKNLFLHLSKLIFNPAAGSTARVKKVRDERIKLVTDILGKILSDEKLRNSPPVKEFLRISNLTFDLRLGKSYKEGWVKVSFHPRTKEDEKLEWKGKASCFCCVVACAPDTGRCTQLLEPRYRKNRKMWAVVKPTFIAFFQDGPGSADPRKADIVIKFSQFFEIHKGYSSTGSHRAIKLVEESKVIRLKFSHRNTKKLWSQSIIDAYLQSKEAFLHSNRPAAWSRSHENNSFAPRRYHTPQIDMEVCRAEWHVDGESYFGAVYEGLRKAESQIFIQGWWVCANLPLVRPSLVNDDSKTLLGVLKERAEAGVQICILMYQEVSLALPLDSSFQEKEFKKLEQYGDVFILRHPEHLIKANSTWFWSHHEKLVVIDQTHAFCGGIDLSWGRFDNHKHRLFDPLEHGSEKVFPGIDFSNVRTKDFENVSNIGRQQHPDDCPRMPWHDVHCEWWGAIARDLARHFTHQWNFARLTNIKDRYAPDLVPMDIMPIDYLVAPRQSDPSEKHRIKAIFSPINEHSARELGNLRSDDSIIATEGGLEIQKEGGGRPIQLHLPSGEMAKGRESTSVTNNRHSNTPRGEETPESDIESDEQNSDEAKDTEDFESENLQRKISSASSEATINEEDLETEEVPSVEAEEIEEEENGPNEDDDEKEERQGEEKGCALQDELEQKENYPEEIKIPGPGPDSPKVRPGLLPSNRLLDLSNQIRPGRILSNDNCDSQPISSVELFQKRCEVDWSKAHAESIPISNLGYAVDAQVVRSLGEWSGMWPGEREKSVQHAMKSLIEDAKNFVYIENQFFISGLESDNTIYNRVLNSLFKRIVRAHESKTPFKVYVVIPLLPGFDGNVVDSSSIRHVLYFQYRTISRSPNSLFHNLLNLGIDPDEYICFFSLRTWEAVGESKANSILGRSFLSTELVYVHSKVLLVDDTVCMIGSGNINDRSLVGKRDTELSVVVRNPGGEFEANPTKSFARALRLYLFREHWGLSPDLEEAILEPWTESNFQKLRSVAVSNTGIYEKHFNLVPRNDIRTERELRAAAVPPYTTIQYSESTCRALRNIQGHVVIFPLNFLCLWDDLKPAALADPTAAILGEELYN